MTMTGLLVIGAFDHHIDAIISTIYIWNLCFGFFVRIPFVKNKMKRYANACTHSFIHLRSEITSLHFRFICGQYDLSKPFRVCKYVVNCKCEHLMCRCWFEPWYFRAQIKTITECVTFMLHTRCACCKQLSIYWTSESCMPLAHSQMSVINMYTKIQYQNYGSLWVCIWMCV